MTPAPAPAMEITATLVPRVPGVWTIEGSLRMCHAKVPIRCTMLALSKKPSPPSSPAKNAKPNKTELLVICPFDPTPQLVAALKLHGTVKYILAPNTMHYLYAAAFKAAFPEAKLIAPAALVAKAPELPVDFVYPSLPSTLPSDVVQFFQVPLQDEIVVLHKPSKTLVVTDLAFNFEAGGEVTPPGPPLSWYLYLANGYCKCSLTSPFKWLIKEPAVLKASLDQLMAKADFDTLIMAHGTVVLKGGKQAFQAGTVTFVENLASAKPWVLPSLPLVKLPSFHLPSLKGLHLPAFSTEGLKDGNVVKGGVAAGLVVLSVAAAARYWVARR